MQRTYQFTDDDATNPSVVGGKGANLGVMTRAGFPVPAGFVVSARSYTEFFAASGLQDEILGFLSGLDYEDAEAIEDVTAGIRAQILGASVPVGIATEIVDGYDDLGADVYVAVRSSGTMEDGAEASYAGLHDTLLDIRGADALLSAVKACWSSLWTGRATAYRQVQGLDHFQSPIAVVVQTMVQSEIAGVMYTAHPVTTATDEIVINASWGLGEAVVASMVNPDTYVVKANTLRVKTKELGSKEVRVVRAVVADADAHDGTVTEVVSDADRSIFTLSDERAAELARIGRRIEEHYGGLPQDIEWAFADGRFAIVQSRPLTGVEFSWDAEVDEGLWSSDEEDDTIWTRDMADENWTGAISPLMYSYRGPAWVAGHSLAANQWGHRDLAGMRFFKYYKAEAYYNSKVEKTIIERTLPPALRRLHVSGLAKLPPDWREEALNAPFSYAWVLKQYARVEALQPQLYKGFKTLDHYMYAPESLTRANGLTVEQTRDLSAGELKRYLNGQIEYEFEYLTDLWTWFFINARDAFLLLGHLVSQWYEGDPAEAMAGLVTGVDRKTKTLEANHDLWLLSERIRKSPTLLETFRNCQGAAFFDECENSEDGREFLASYATFLKLYGHRGHSDRDIAYPRREEDPSMDYTALTPMLSGVLEHGADSEAAMADPEERERQANAHRQEVTAQVLESIRLKPFGGVRAELFKVVLNYCHTFIMARDDERHFIDYITYSIRRGFLEMGRRLVARGDLEDVREVFFLSRDELYELFDGRARMPLTRAKIQARMRDFDQFNERTRVPPPYLHRGQEVDFDAVEHDGNVLSGIGASRGTVTGTARIAKGLHEIGRIKRGDILVCNSTDPGWTPVFSVISGIVLETGGMTAHGAMLAREYGLPAVQLANATRLVPDGATIELNGNAGLVILPEHDDEVPVTDQDGSDAAVAPSPEIVLTRS